MDIYTESFQVKTKGETDIIDITEKVRSALNRSGLKSGSLTVFISGSTAGITTIEYEGGVVKDLKDAYERLAPRNADYQHNLRWGDGNGYAHIRASLTGQDITIPFSEGTMITGTWQQIILIDFDNRSRTRECTVQVIGK
jgi:secondary thiamine-phosphate synthase enzyme